MEAAPALFRFHHEAMNTAFEFVIPETEGDESYASQAARAAFAEIDILEDQLSRFRPSSDIAQINALKSGSGVRVGLAAMDCLVLAKAVHAETDGAFDISVGPLMKIFRDPGGGLRLTTPDEEAWARARFGMQLFEIDEVASTVTVRADNITLDLGAVGKGYALDQCVEILQNWSVKNALLNAGDSTVLGIGSAPNREGWPVSAGNRNKRTVTLRDNALSGSGFHVKGAHIINPRTMRPVPPKADRTWCIAPTAALSDALSTAFMIMMPEEIGAFCERNSGIMAILD